MGVSGLALVGWLATAGPLQRATEQVPTQIQGAPVALAFVVGDLRLLAGQWRERLEGKRGIELVDRLLDADAPARLGLDPADWVNSWAPLLRPQDGPVPVTFAVGGTPDAPWVVLSAAASPGVVDRLVEAQPLPELRFERGEADAAVRLTGLPVPVAGRHEDGWLRLFLGPEALSLEATGLVLGPLAGGPTEEATTAVVWDGTSPIARGLREQATDETDRTLLSVRRVTVLTGQADARTDWVTARVDHPQLALISPFLTDGVERTGAADVWGPRARSMVDVSVPAGWLHAALEGLQPPPRVATALKRTDGRLGFASFEGIADWGIAFGFDSNESAEAAVPAVRGWLRQASGKLAPKLADLIHPNAGPSFSIRPAPDLAGLQCAAVDDRIVIWPQAMRTFSEEATGTPLRTARVSEFLRRPSLLTSYTMVGTDPMLLSLYQWFAAVLPAVPEVDAAADDLPDWLKAPWRDFLAGLPRALALAQIQSMFIYDMGARLDIRGTSMTLDFVISEL